MSLMVYLIHVISKLVLSTGGPPVQAALGRLCLWAYRLFSTGDRLGKNGEIRANFIKIGANKAKFEGKKCKFFEILIILSSRRPELR